VRKDLDLDVKVCEAEDEQNALGDQLDEAQASFEKIAEEEAKARKAKDHYDAQIKALIAQRDEASRSVKTCELAEEAASQETNIFLFAFSTQQALCPLPITYDRWTSPYIYCFGNHFHHASASLLQTTLSITMLQQPRPALC
jgi:hypothetical protein